MRGSVITAPARALTRQQHTQQAPETANSAGERKRVPTSSYDMERGSPSCRCGSRPLDALHAAGRPRRRVCVTWRAEPRTHRHTSLSGAVLSSRVAPLSVRAALRSADAPPPHAWLRDARTRPMQLRLAAETKPERRMRSSTRNRRDTPPSSRLSQPLAQSWSCGVRALQRV